MAEWFEKYDAVYPYAGHSWGSLKPCFEAFCSDPDEWVWQSLWERKGRWVNIECDAQLFRSLEQYLNGSDQLRVAKRGANKQLSEVEGGDDE